MIKKLGGKNIYIYIYIRPFRLSSFVMYLFVLLSLQSEEGGAGGTEARPPYKETRPAHADTINQVVYSGV